MEQDKPLGAGVDKRLVRRAFDRAATQYDAHAVLQREVAHRMLARLDYIRHQPARVLDVGTGTGYGVQGLRQHYPRAHLIALDLALEMLKIACPPAPFWNRWRNASTEAVCADMDCLPLQNASVDMVWSSLALQWSNDLRVSFSELRRVLAPGGLLMFSTFGPDTLKELRSAFATVDGYAHVNHFVDMHDIGDLLLHSGFSDPVVDMEFITLTYADLAGMMRDLKAIGAHNVSEDRNRGLTGRASWRAFEAAMEAFRDQGRLPLTYEVIYGHAWVNSQTQPKDGVQTVTWHKRVQALE
ncbi:MAG: malonyl-ACP O-methyltransferase BioC [Betaproteobacteria bacterium]|nr:malonyl-ACP O-methyltransferase BioC [Betaproteobacteria bacterium]